MIPRVIDTKHEHGFVLHIRFSDGSDGAVDLDDELHGEVFDPLNESSYLKQFSIHPELHTITWPNGADFAPEFPYEKIEVLT